MNNLNMMYIFMKVFYSLPVFQSNPEWKKNGVQWIRSWFFVWIVQNNFPYSLKTKTVKTLRFLLFELFFVWWFWTIFSGLIRGQSLFYFPPPLFFSTSVFVFPFTFWFPKRFTNESENPYQSDLIEDLKVPSWL